MKGTNHQTRRIHGNSNSTLAEMQTANAAIRYQTFQGAQRQAAQAESCGSYWLQAASTTNCPSLPS